MELFVCSSNYQLLNAIMIITEYQIEADLIIIRESIWSGCKLDILIRERIFKQIYKWTNLFENIADERIKNLSDKIKIQFKKAVSYIDKKKIWDSLPNKNQKYTKIHIAYVDSVTLWIYTYFKRTGAQLSLYEDGTYSYGCLDVKKPFLRKLFERLLYGGTGIDECVQMYVKHPEKVKLGSHTLRLLSIEDSFDSDIVTKILLPLYQSDMDNMLNFKRKVIFFDQNLELKEIKKIQKNVANETAKIFGKNNVLVKMHPSSRDVEYGKDIKTFRGRIPFELVMAYEDMNEKLLISIFSTACTSPKLDFNQEPYVIFTYKLYGDKFSIDDKYLEQINQLIHCYNDKFKVKIPNNMEEFIQIIKVIKEDIQ